jgi:photosystem II stability/assembly factor-like uncharacterized protein
MKTVRLFVCFSAANKFIAALVCCIWIGETAHGQWRLQATLSGNPPLVSVKTVSRDVAWICGFGRIVYRTTDGGTTWTPTSAVSTTEDLSCIEALDANTAFVGGGGSGWAGGSVKIYRTTNGGAGWQIVYSAPGLGNFWNAIRFFDAQNGIAQSDPSTSGGSFLIVKTTDGGTTWTPIANPPVANTNEFGSFNCLHFFDAQNGWFGTTHPPFLPGGNAGRVFRTTNGGTTWTGVSSGNGETVNAVRFISPTVGIRTSDAAPFLTRTTDGGQTWATVSGLPVSGIQGIYAGAGVVTPALHQLWVYGEASSPFILTSTNGGTSWTQQAIAGTPANSIWHMSAITFGAANDSVQAFGVTFDINSLASGGQVFNYRNRTGLITGATEMLSVPDGFSLAQNYPNPFNPTTTIEYAVPLAAHLRVDVYDVLGRRVAQLVNGYAEAGRHQIGFNGTGRASGIFFYTLNAQSGAGTTFTQTRRMILQK